MNFFDNLMGKLETCVNGLLRLNEPSKSGEIRRMALSHPLNLAILPPEMVALPHRTIVIIDKSGSMAFTDYYPSRLEAAKQASEKFAMKRSQLSLEDQMAIIGFEEKADVYLSWSAVGNRSKIAKALRKMKASGGTDLAEGLKAAKALFKRADNADYFRRILLLSDGQGGNPVSIAQTLKNQEVLIQVIGIAGDRSEVNEAILKATATTDQGGFTHYWFIEDSQSLIALYEQLSTRIVIGRK